MRYEEKYNRHIADNMYELHSEEWIFNAYGNLSLRQIDDDEQQSKIAPIFYQYDEVNT